MSVSEPLVLQRMSPQSAELLKEDLARWGTEIQGLSYRAVGEATGLGPGRSERLHAWIAHHGLTPPATFGGDGEKIPNRPPDPEQVDEEFELADPDASPPAKNRFTVSQPGPLELKAEAEANDAHSSPVGQGIVRNLDELMAQAEIDPALWAADDFQNRTWATPMRRRMYGPDGSRLPDEIRVVRSWYVSAKFRRRLDACVSSTDWTPRLERSPGAHGRPERVALVIPDMHVGYQWSVGHQRLVPLHDWNAIDLVLQIANLIQPTEIQILGDGLDLAAFSTKFAVPLALRDTVRPSLLTMHGLLRMLRATFPTAGIDYQGGNHEKRTESGLVGTEYDGLSVAGSDLPVHSFANLLGLDALDITWRRYGEHRWLWDSIMVHHGDKIKPRGGLTTAAVIADSPVSVIFGHIHRLEQASRTVHGPRGRKVITAASPGTLGRIDGSLPGASARPDWQQGFGVVTLDEDGQDHIELIPIHNGSAFYLGRKRIGDGVGLSDMIAQQIGYPQVAGGGQA
ncbi:MAG: hypothetical protein ABL912_01985 [Novosphingobium sp.]